MECKRLYLSGRVVNPMLWLLWPGGGSLGAVRGILMSGSVAWER
jgi:hypothetical protein